MSSPTQNSKQKSKQINNVQKQTIMPLTNSNFPLKSQSKQFPQSFSIDIHNHKITLLYRNYQSEQKLIIKIIHQQTCTVYQIQLTREVLLKMDPSVLATFQNIQTMYRQFVQILKKTPQEFQINDDGSNGVIKVQVSMAMKSGIKKRQLILITDKRQMNEIEVVQKSREQSENSIRKQLNKSRLQNQALKNVLMQVKQQFKKQITQVYQKVQKQTKNQSKYIKLLQKKVQNCHKQLNYQSFMIKLLKKGAHRNLLSPDKNSKCYEKDYKFVHFEEHGNKQISIIKIGKQKWSQLMFAEPLHFPVSFYQIEIKQTKNNYICLGIGHTKLLSEQDSKWQKSSITLFMLDKTIISEGKQIKNPIQIQQVKPAQHISQNDSKNKRPTIITVIINCLNKSIQWYENITRIGFVEFSQQFKKYINDQQIRPYIIMKDINDKVITQ